jgi:hypothetical protein
MESLQATLNLRSELLDSLVRAGEAEFPGIPSTQEWREDFPATQVPPREPRNAYITPQTSFSLPSGDAERVGFDFQLLPASPRRPSVKWKETQQMPPTPKSITKSYSHSKKEYTSARSPCLRAGSKGGVASALKLKSPLNSPVRRSDNAAKSEEIIVPRRRKRRQNKPYRAPEAKSEDLGRGTGLKFTKQSCSVPEPWPLPFPQSDRGIHPYLPPAIQFEQMVKFTSATEEHIDKWNLHDSTYPVPLLRQVLSAQECVHMGFYAQLENLDKMLAEMEKMMKPIPAKERALRGNRGERYRRTSPQMLERIKFMRSITKQHQVFYYESRIPTGLNLRRADARSADEISTGLSSVQEIHTQVATSHQGYGFKEQSLS